MFNDVTDEVLRRELSPLREQATAPVSTIEGRANNLRRTRRRRLVLPAVAAGVSVAALTAAAAFHVVPWETTASGEVPICTAYVAATTGGMEAYPIDPSELPAGMHMVWDQALGSAGYANARRIESSCEEAPYYLMRDVQDGTVARAIDIVAMPVGEDGETPSDMNPSSGPTDVRTYKPDPGKDDGFSRANWTTEDGYWVNVEARGMSEEDLVGLLQDLEVTNGDINPAAWSGAASFEVSRLERIADSGTSFVWFAASEMPDGGPKPPELSLLVRQANDPLLMAAEIGDQVTEVAGEPALQSQDGTITWKPSTDTWAQVSGTLSKDQLLDAMRSVHPIQ